MSVGRRVNQDRLENGKNGRKSHRKTKRETVSERRNEGFINGISVLWLSWRERQIEACGKAVF